MTWIEHIFGVDPDAGSGLLELALLIFLALVLALVVASWRHRRNRSTTRQSRADAD